MKFRISVLFFLLLSINIFGQNFPKPTGLVNDFANILKPQTKTQITNLLTDLKGKTGVEIAVVTMSDIGGQDYTDYTNRLYENWKIGKKGTDEGLLIFLTVKERKIRIEVGYGLEGLLPDGKVGTILDNYVVPLLKKGDFDGGINNAALVTSAIIAQDKGVQIGTASRIRKVPKVSKKSLLGALIPLLIIFLLFGRKFGFWQTLFLFSMLSGRGFGGFGGGMGGGGFGGFGGGLSGGGGAGRGF